jgi:predicted O-methyltransferase YrrM
MQDWIARLFEDRELLRMGHGQRRDDLNLGLGWLYYALARTMRPATVVVIGSWRGFVPMMFARALHDNNDGGRVVFIDPSLADDFWRDADKVSQYFAGHGISNVRHYLMTTQQFVDTADYRELHDIGIHFVDGYHTEQQVRFDHESFAGRMVHNGITLFHDSFGSRTSSRYGAGKEYVCTVKDYLEKLRSRKDLQVFDLPFGEGVTLVQRPPVNEMVFQAKP